MRGARFSRSRKGASEKASEPEISEPPRKRPHPTLQKNFEACLKEFPPEKYGKYYLKEKGAGKWAVMCEPCNQLMAIPSTNLSNFTRTHIREAKHMGNVEKMQNAARLAAEEEAGKEKKLREARKEMIRKYVGQGKNCTRVGLIRIRSDQACSERVEAAMQLVVEDSSAAVHSILKLSIL